MIFFVSKGNAKDATDHRKIAVKIFDVMKHKPTLTQEEPFYRYKVVAVKLLW